MKGGENMEIKTKEELFAAIADLQATVATLQEKIDTMTPAKEEVAEEVAEEVTEEVTDEERDEIDDLFA